MRPYSQKERSILKELVSRGNEMYSLGDFMEVNCPSGQLEMSSYQQKLVLYLSEKGVSEQWMTHLLQTIDLITYLEKRGYLQSWEAFPMEDNTRIIGERPEGSLPEFLPDLSVSGKLLQLANKRFILNESLRDLIARDFRSVSYLRHRSMKTTIITGFIFLGLMLAANGYIEFLQTDKRFDQTDDQVQIESRAIKKNQSLNRSILDSLSFQSKQLLMLINQISLNTEHIQEMSGFIENQGFRVRRLERMNGEVLSQLEKNRHILVKTDSLLNNLQSNTLINR